MHISTYIIYYTVEQGLTVNPDDVLWFSFAFQVKVKCDQLAGMPCTIICNELSWLTMSLFLLLSRPRWSATSSPGCRARSFVMISHSWQCSVFLFPILCNDISLLTKSRFWFPITSNEISWLTMSPFCFSPGKGEAWQVRRNAVHDH